MFLESLELFRENIQTGINEKSLEICTGLI